MLSGVSLLLHIQTVRVSCWVFMQYFLYFEFLLFRWYDVWADIFFDMCQGVSCFTCRIYSPQWIVVCKNMHWIFILISFTRGDGVICPFFHSPTLEVHVSNLGGRVSTLGGGVVCFYIGFLSFSLGGYKFSDNLDNASIWISPTLWNGAEDILLIACFNLLAACRILSFANVGGIGISCG